MEKQGRPWKRYAALAACFAVVLTACFAADRLRPAEEHGGGQAEAGIVEDSSLDGNDYSTPEDAPAQPIHSVGVEIGELWVESGKPWEEGEDGVQSSSSLVWLEPEEIFVRDTAIFRGTVLNLRYFEVTAGGETRYYTVASVEVTDCVRGELAAGDIYGVLYLGAAGRMSTSISGNLERLEVGSDAVFMPYIAAADTGWSSGADYFCYADLAELYFEEGIRFLFLDTGDGLSFERNVYADIADAETLDEVMDYLRENVPNADEPPETAAEVFEAADEPPETAQATQTPVEPQAEPASTAEAFPAGIQSGPAGARELPGGAVVGEEWEIAICTGDGDSDFQVGEPDWNDTAE